MKAIILTYAPVDKDEQELLRNTRILKVAINHHAEEYNPDVRVCGDWNLASLCHNFKQPIVSLRDHFRFISPRVINNNIEFKGATIIGAVEWLIEEGYKDILIIGDNTVNTEKFQKNVNKKLFILLWDARIYQYKEGNFDLPVMSIKEFIGEENV